MCCAASALHILSVAHSLCISRYSHLILGLVQLHVQWVTGPLSPEVSSQGMKLTTHPHLVSGLEEVVLYLQSTTCISGVIMTISSLPLRPKPDSFCVTCRKIFLLYTLSFDTFSNLIFCQIDVPGSNLMLFRLCSDASMQGSQIMGARLCG
jgi:hypothetical protein